MNFIRKIFPFVPAKGEVGKFILALLFYILLTPIGLPVGVIVLGITIVLAVLVPIFAILLPVYSLFGFIATILGFCGALENKNPTIVEVKAEE